MRFVINPYREAGPFPLPSRKPVRDFHRTLPGYAPTPLFRMTGLARRLGIADLYLKYEGTRFGLSAFKGLGGSWALHRLLATRPGTFTTVSTASEGNHGRAVAWAARLMGVPCVIFLPAHAAPERIANIRNEGATVVLVDGNYEDAVRRCDRESKERGWQIISDVGYEGYLEIPPLVVEGYATIFLEIDEQLAAGGWPRPDLVLVPGGVGGILQAGVDHFRALSAPPTIVGVEPEAGDCLAASLAAPGGVPAVSAGDRNTTLACLNCAEVSWPSWPNIRRGVDAILAIEDQSAIDAVRRLYRPPAGDPSIEAGNSGAAATGGLLALTTDPRCAPLKEHLGVGPTTVALVLCTEAAIDQTEFHRVIGRAG
ncbi:MAG: pyridoxal-phosphate dependent enzyme [Gemmatimonadales bacterium]